MEKFGGVGFLFLGLLFDLVLVEYWVGVLQYQLGVLFGWVLFQVVVLFFVCFFQFFVVEQVFGCGDGEVWVVVFVYFVGQVVYWEQMVVVEDLLVQFGGQLFGVVEFVFQFGVEVDVYVVFVVGDVQGDVGIVFVWCFVVFVGVGVGV